MSEDPDRAPSPQQDPYPQPYPQQQPYSQPYPQQQPYPPQPQPQYQPLPRNGFGITSLIVGLASICIGIIPLFGLFAVIGGIVAVTFGLLGHSRARKGLATNKKTAIFGILAGLLAGFLGIVGLSIVSNALSGLSNSVSGLAPSASDSASPTPGGDASGSNASFTGSFGQEIAWPDGVAVSTGTPKAFTPSNTAAKNGSDVRYISIVITMTNRTPKNLDSSGLSVNATADGRNADDVFDSAQNIGVTPNSTILPGKSITYTQVFGLTSSKPVDLQVELRPSFGFGYQPAIFTGKV